MKPLLTIGKLWKYIGHTIVPYNTTIQGYCTIKLQSLDTYHPILLLLTRLLFYFMILCIVELYGAIE